MSPPFIAAFRQVLGGADFLSPLLSASGAHKQLQCLVQHYLSLIEMKEGVAISLQMSIN